MSPLVPLLIAIPVVYLIIGVSLAWNFREQIRQEEHPVLAAIRFCLFMPIIAALVGGIQLSRRRWRKRGFVGRPWL